MIYYICHINQINNLQGGTVPFFQPCYISVELRYRNNRLKSGLWMVWQLCERYSTVSPRKGWHLIFCMEEKICSFFGHRDVAITEQLYATTTTEIIKAVELGCRIFYFGGYGTFDSLCHKIVTEMKHENPALNIKRIYCVSQERYLHKSVRYFDRGDYDEIIYLMPSFEGWYKSIYFRNCAMIDQSDLILFYAESRENSGAYKAYQYAKKKKDKRVINLWEYKLDEKERAKN